MNDIKTINDHVVFQFLDKVHNGQFCEETIGLIIMANHGKDHNKDANMHRLAKVIDVGPKCVEVKKDDIVIVEKLRWTPGFKIHLNDEYVEVWRTNEKHILGIIEPDDIDNVDAV